MTGPRSEPRWTVPDGVFESLMTCGPLTLAASSSAQSMLRASSQRPRADGDRGAVGCLSGDRDDLVREVAGRHLDDDLFALLLAEEGAPDRTLVADPALGRLGLGGADDGELLLAII